MIEQPEPEPLTVRRWTEVVDAVDGSNRRLLLDYEQVGSMRTLTDLRVEPAS